MKEKRDLEKKDLREVLSKFYKENEKLSIGKETFFFKEGKEELKKASFSYKSLMEVHVLLKKVYKNLLKKTEK